MQNKTDNKKPISLNYILSIIIVFVFLVSLVIGSAFSFKTGRIIDKKITTAKEASRPANLEIISITDPVCDNCFQLTSLLTEIKDTKKYNTKVAKETNLTLDSAEAQALIKEWAITKVPALVIKGEVSKDKNLESLLNKVGTIKDGTFVLTQNGAPYMLVATKEIKGTVELTLLTDSSCANCYQVGIHERILGGFGMTNKKKNMIDVDSPEGKKLVQKYDITLVPTILLSGDIDAYPNIGKVWPQVGTVETDGTYIFRTGVAQMGVYRDLSTGKIVEPPKQAAPVEQK